MYVIQKVVMFRRILMFVKENVLHINGMKIKPKQSIHDAMFFFVYLFSVRL